MEEIPEICGALCLKRNDSSFHITILVSFKTKTDIESQEKHCSTRTSDVQKARRLVIKRLELEIHLAALRCRRCRTELAGQVEKLETSSKMEEISLDVEETGYARERKEKHLDEKLQGRFKKRKPRYTLSRKVWLKRRKLTTVPDPDSGELHSNSVKTGKKKERHEKLLEEVRQNADEAQERASESERSLCRELEEFMYSWEPEIGRTNNLSTKIWQMMQSHNTKSEKFGK